MSVLVSKFKEVLLSVVPITIIVLILNFTIAPIETVILIKFLLGAIFLVIGLTLFLVGVDIGITPIGNHMGGTLAKTNKLWIIVVFGLILGFFISVAEPDLHILAGQVDTVSSGLISKGSIVVVVSIGIAIMIAVGLVRIVYNFPLYKLLTIIYGIVFLFACLTSREFLAISFDASGATTGALTVPFILAIAIGVSQLKKNSKASEKDSFGLVAIASTGAMIAVMVMSIISKTGEISGSVEVEEANSAIFSFFWQEFISVAPEILIALLPILILFIIFQKKSFHLPKREVRKIVFGLIFTYVGLVIFLVGVNAGFMNVGSIIGSKIASLDNKLYVVVVGFILGVVTILAEPAVYVLTNQIESVTSGYVKKNIVMFTLAIGVGIAVALSIMRILTPELQLWQFLLPGYLLSIILTYIAPKLFVGIAFDSGGVASGPMTATFILAYTQGAAGAIEGANVLVDGFGVIAMVAMTPLIALQLLGIVFKIKAGKAEVKVDGESK